KHGLTPPKTWSEFLDLLEKLKKIEGVEAPIASGDGVGWPLSDMAEAFIINRGSPDLQNKLIAGEITFTDPAVRKCFEELADLLKKGYFSEPGEWTAQIDKLWEGKYGIYFMGCWMTVMPQVKDVNDLGFFPFPEAKGVVAGGDWVVIPKYTEHLKEAKMLLKFLAGAEAQEIMVRQGGFLATNFDVPAEAYKPADKAVVDFMKTVSVVADLDDAIGGEFQLKFWDQLKLLWVEPEALDDVLKTISEAQMATLKGG
ncbi:MAG: ABC transporter substrate-binding protein, partial [Thermoproteota archaeon]